VHLIYAKHFIPQTRHDVTPQNACTEQSLCTANPNTVTCNTEDFATSCNLHEPKESNNRSRYNRKQTTHWNKRQKDYLKERSSIEVNLLHRLLTMYVLVTQGTKPSKTIHYAEQKNFTSLFQQSALKSTSKKRHRFIWLLKTSFE